MGVLKLFEGTGDLHCAIATIKTPEGVVQKVVDGSAFSVGRAPDCVLSIPEVGISRLHMLVTIKRGEIYITDQGSSNGTFLNGERIEPKRLIHVKATDEIKLGKTEFVLQLGVVEKHFKTDYIAESLLPQNEKDNLMNVIKASQHKAQEIVAMAQMQADQMVQIATEKSRNIQNQTLLMQEDILSKAQVESQGIVSETKRKAAQMIMEAEEQAKEATRAIHFDADQKRNEAEQFYKDRTQEAQVRADEIIAQHTKMGQEMVEDLRQKTIERVEKEAKEQLSSLFKVLDEKTEELAKLQAEVSTYSEKRKQELEAELAKVKDEFHRSFEFERQTALDDHHSKMAVLEAEYLHKRKELEESESRRIQEIEERVQILNQRLDREYAEKRIRLEHEYADKTVSYERDYNTRKSKLEEGYQERQKELSSTFDKNRKELESALELKRSVLEKEVESQRQTLVTLRTEVEKYTEDHSRMKAEIESLTENLKVMRKTDEELALIVHEKRQDVEAVTLERNKLAQEVNDFDAQIKDIKVLHANVKSNFEKDKQRLEDESERLRTDYQSEFDALKKKFEIETTRLKKENEQETLRIRADIVKKTQDYMDLEKIKLDEYRSQLLNEKKQLDLKFEATKKEFESKTREMIELEKRKVEDQKQHFLVVLNQQRASVINELTKSVLRVERGGANVVSAQQISQAVESVFDEHVAELSITSHNGDSAQKENEQKVRWILTGVFSTLLLVVGIGAVLMPSVRKLYQDPEQVRREMQIAMERPKFQRSLVPEARDNYVDSVVETLRYAEIYLDEDTQEKWFKFISAYMYDSWRVPEEKTIEAVAIAKTLVSNLEQTAQGLDQEFASKGIEKMREVEAESVERMSDILGTRVKLEAFKRKEKEFFEPYIVNQ